jgi:hypothetical protein
VCRRVLCLDTIVGVTPSLVHTDHMFQFL